MTGNPIDVIVALLVGSACTIGGAAEWRWAARISAGRRENGFMFWPWQRSERSVRGEAVFYTVAGVASLTFALLRLSGVVAPFYN